jgi:monothiol glutaredoxin
MELTQFFSKKKARSFADFCQCKRLFDIRAGYNPPRKTTPTRHPMDALERIKQQVTENPVVLYMKGTPDFPQCGFSSRTVQAIKSCGVKFAAVNIYQDEEIYRALPKFANWPTFPQLYVKGELIGGCDITLELHASGELQKMLKEVAA